MKFNIHANIWSDNVHIMCPPKDVKDLLEILKDVPGIDINLFPSADEAKDV